MKAPGAKADRIIVNKYDHRICLELEDIKRLSPTLFVRDLNAQSYNRPHTKQFFRRWRQIFSSGGSSESV
jgi:hypothetical protein